MHPLALATLAAAVAAVPAWSAAGAQPLVDRPVTVGVPPQLQLAQRIAADGAGQPSVRVTTDRHAFLTVFEIGVDGRLRIVHPTTPGGPPMVAAGTTVPVTLPSFASLGYDAASGMPMVVDRVDATRPFVLAFASDVGANLAPFGERDGAWAHQFVVDGSLSPDVVAARLGAVLFEAGVPYTVVHREIAPPLASSAALRLARLYERCAVIEGGVAGLVDVGTRWRLLDLFALTRQPTDRSPWGTTDVRERYAMPAESATRANPDVTIAARCPGGSALAGTPLWGVTQAPAPREARAGDLVLDGMVLAREAFDLSAATDDARAARATARRDADFARRTAGWGNAGGAAWTRPATPLRTHGGTRPPR